MEGVIKVRQRMGQLEGVDFGEYDGYVAHYDPKRIGETIYLRPLGYNKVEKFLITDCCSWIDGSCNWMRRNNIFVEVDAKTIDRWGEALGKDLYLRLVKVKYMEDYKHAKTEEWRIKRRFRIPMHFSSSQ